MITYAVDWSILIHELRFTHGMTMIDISKEVQLSHESIRIYYNRIARPKHHDGEKLIALWQRVTNKPREVLPTETIISAAKTHHS